MQISFHGADQNVTGSCHLVECAGTRILVDCGLYQGDRELVEENSEPFGFEPESIDFLLLTHAHLDHCGRIPLLVKRGFTGEVITTGASMELARLVLLDAAGIQEEDARYAQHRARRKHGSDAAPVEPLYTTLDALNSMECFGRRPDYGETLQLADGVRATFLDAGHILGSAIILLELEEDGRRHRLLFSGDLGYGGRPILRDPTPPPHVDTVVMETTYGDRLHKPLQPSLDEFYQAINETLERRGNVIIPTFALERAQELLYYLREGYEQGRLEHRVDVFLDSPMAISATRIFERHPECFDAEALGLARGGRDPFGLPGLHFTRESAESIAINEIKDGAIVMAGSGMCTGGRIRHHLKHNLWHERNSVVFVGFAARGTLARSIIDGARHVHIFGEEIPVRAKVHTINGFSAHADQAELLAWHAQTGHPATTYLVHGEEESMRALGAKLRHTKVVMPRLDESHEL